MYIPIRQYMYHSLTKGKIYMSHDNLVLKCQEYKARILPHWVQSDNTEVIFPNTTLTVESALCGLRVESRYTTQMLTGRECERDGDIIRMFRWVAETLAATLRCHLIVLAGHPTPSNRMTPYVPIKLQHNWIISPTCVRTDFCHVPTFFVFCRLPMNLAHKHSLISIT